MEYLTAGWGPLAAGLFWVAAGVSGAWALGSLVVPKLIGAEGSEPAAPLLSLAAGLAVVSLVLLAMGSCGLTGSWAFRSLFLGLLALGVVRAWPRLFGGTSARPGPPVCAAIAVAALAAAALLLPPAGTDALSYHLSDPKYFLLHGRIGPVPFSRESLWPYLTEMFFMSGLACQGTTAAVAWHWVFFPLTAWAAWLLGRRMGGAAAAGWAAWIWVMTPAAFAQSSDAYIDLAFAFYAACAFVALELWLERPGRGRAFLLGAMIGGCLSVKLLAVGLAGVAVLVLLWRSRDRVRDAGWFAAGAAAVAGVWYLRSWWLLGNPVYPFFPSVFDGNGLENDIAGRGAGTSWVHFLLLPWNLVMRPYAFGGEIAGPWLLLFGWAGIVPELRRRNGRVTAMAVLATAAFLFSQSQMTRFFLMLLPWAAALAAAGYVRIRQWGGPASAAALAAMLAVSGFHLSIAAYRLRDAVSLGTGTLTPEAYLKKVDRSYRAYEFLDRTLGKGERVLNAADAKRFWGPTDRMTVVNGILRDHWRRTGVTIPEFLEREDFDWLMLTERSDPAYWEFANTHGYEEKLAYDFREPTEIMKFRILKKGRS